jgi:hypothetical protein
MIRVANGAAARSPVADPSRGLTVALTRRSRTIETRPSAHSPGSGTPTEMKARQLSKIRELGDALVTSGFHTLDEQANALGLPRSTTWTILRGKHKASGLSATVINQMLAAPQLPPLVRARILEYVDDKNAGLYGHSKMQLRRFAARLSAERLHHYQMKLAEEHHEARKQLSRVPQTFVARATR